MTHGQSRRGALDPLGAEAAPARSDVWWNAGSNSRDLHFSWGVCWLSSTTWRSGGHGRACFLQAPSSRDLYPLYRACQTISPQTREGLTTFTDSSGLVRRESPGERRAASGHPEHRPRLRLSSRSKEGEGHLSFPNARLRPRWHTRVDSPSQCEDGQVMMVLDAMSANQRAMRANRCTRRAQEVWPPKTFQRADHSNAILANRLNVRPRLPFSPTQKTVRGFEPYALWACWRVRTC